QRETGAVVRTGAFEVASLDHQHVVTSVPVLIHPMADGIARECRLDILADVLGPVASVGKDSTRVLDVLHQEMGGMRRHDDFHRLIHVHHPGHAGRKTSKRWVSALSAGSLILEVGPRKWPDTPRSAEPRARSPSVERRSAAIGPLSQDISIHRMPE